MGPDNLRRRHAPVSFTGGVAHDFNNLLTVIRGNLDLVAARGDPKLDRLLDADHSPPRAPGRIRQCKRGVPQ
jgi:signal transduction histidine kinase